MEEEVTLGDKFGEHAVTTLAAPEEAAGADAAAVPPEPAAIAEVELVRPGGVASAAVPGDQPRAGAQAAGYADGAVRCWSAGSPEAERVCFRWVAAAAGSVRRPAHRGAPPAAATAAP